MIDLVKRGSCRVIGIGRPPRPGEPSIRISLAEAIERSLAPANPETNDETRAAKRKWYHAHKEEANARREARRAAERKAGKRRIK